MSTSRSVLMPALLGSVLAAGVARAADGVRVDHTGRIRTLRAGAEFHKITTDIVVARPGWEGTHRLGQVEKVRHATRDGRRRCRAVIPVGKGGGLAVDEEFDAVGGEVRMTLRLTARADLATAGTYLFVHAPIRTFAGGRCEVIRPDPNTPPAATMPAKLPKEHHFLRGRAAGLRLLSADGRTRLDVTLDRALPFTLQDHRKFKGREYSAFFRLLPDQVAKGDSAEVKVTLRLTVPADDRPARLALDAAKKRFRLDGFGGNFCFRVSSPITEHNLAHIPMAWARVHMNLAQWEPTNDNDSPGETDWAYFRQRDRPGSTVREDLAMTARLAKMRVPTIASTWRVPEFMTAEPGKGWQARKRRLPREKWPEALECVGAYLLHAKRAYQAEPAMVSFNESDIGCFVLMTPEEHRDWIKACGAHLAKLGLKTRMLLGDCTKRDNTAFIAPAAADPEAMKHVGAVAFHTWSKGPRQYRAWRDVARRLKLPLIAAEVGPDAAAHKDRSFNLLHYYVDELRMYQEILLHAEARAILEWQYCQGYQLCELEGGAGGTERVRPTPRFRMIRQFATLTPRPAIGLGTRSDHDKVLFTAFTDEGGKRLVLHVANCGAARKATLTGLPARGGDLQAVQTTWTGGRKELPAVRARDGRLTLDLPEFSLLTLTGGA